MAIFFRILTSLPLLFLLSCNMNTYIDQPLIPKDTTNSKEKNNRLFAFVGEKISLVSLGRVSDLDEGFIAKYKVLQKVYGSYKEDTIEFMVYDHYGEPFFSKYKNVLLFVTEDSGKYYHEKYQYFDVYQAKNGRWAGAYSHDDYSKTPKNLAIIPQRIFFRQEIFYMIPEENPGGILYNKIYPEPYYKIDGHKATAVYGNYVEDLFRLKKNGVLRFRELF